MKKILSFILAIALLLTAFSAFAEESANTPPEAPPGGFGNGTPPGDPPGEPPEGFDGSNPPGEPPEGFGGGKALIDELTDASPDASGDIVEDVALRDALNRFFRGLSARDRKIFLGRYWYAADLATLARAYGESIASVKVVLHRTRLALKKALEEEGIGL